MSDKKDINLSDWMGQLPDKVLDLPLNQIAIPGSHNSCSSTLDPTSGIGTDVAAPVRTFGLIFRDLVYRYSPTQTYSLTEQLSHGIRYFDFRVSTKPNTDSIHFIHAFYGASVDSGLQEINNFLCEHPKEIVLIDFNHFYEMNEIHHKHFLDQIQKIFQEKLCMFTGVENTTLNMLWANNLQVIVFYQNKIVQDNSQFWPSTSIQSPWAKTTEASKLIQYMESKFKEKQREDMFTAWQMVVTPDFMHVLQNANGSVKDLSAQVMPAVLKWLENKRAGDQGLNIVLADFVELQEFPLKVIRLNYE